MLLLAIALTSVNKQLNGCRIVIDKVVFMVNLHMLKDNAP